MENNYSKTYNLLLIFAILFLITGCQKVDLSEINNLNGNKITLIGHGGIGFSSPQNALPHNSFSSLTKAVEAYGLEGVEVDVQMSSDSVIFMYHDKVLETSTDCFGCVFFKESESLINCRYRSGFRNNLFINENLRSIESVLKRFSERPTKPLVIMDVKLALEECGNFDNAVHRQQFLEAIASLIDNYNAQEWCFVESDDLDFLMDLKEILPEVKLSLIPILYSEEEVIEAAGKGVYMISGSNDVMTKAYAQFIHDNGMRLAIYSVKIRKAAIEAINNSPDYIYTDNIILLQEMLR